MQAQAEQHDVRCGRVLLDMLMNVTAAKGGTGESPSCTLLPVHQYPCFRTCASGLALVVCGNGMHVQDGAVSKGVRWIIL